MTAISLNCWSESDQKAIREQLVRILNSGPFHQSQRRQRFLEYLVNETLAGRGERLKGYNIALEVFERPETFDPTVDPLVRIEAARLREKLREYYGTEGQGDPIHIDLPKGTYTPQIEFRHEGAPPIARRRAPGYCRALNFHSSIAIRWRSSTASSSAYMAAAKRARRESIARSSALRSVPTACGP